MEPQKAAHFHRYLHIVSPHPLHLSVIVVSHPAHAGGPGHARLGISAELDTRAARQALLVSHWWL